VTAALLLVRHARSVPPTPGGPDERVRPLTPEGLAQAAALADVLLPHRPSRVVSSPYLRAVQTVRPTADRLGLAVEPDEELREWASGIGPTPDWQPHYRHCWEHPGWATPTGETHAALAVRAVAAVTLAAAETPDGETTVLGSHGTWISRALHGLGCRVDADFWLTMPMPAVYVLRCAGTRVTGIAGPGL
jgi:2,3-bisphosphoglycerate-dependent phosphoglycerate mutase